MENVRPLVSIIIPVYRVEEYIRRCINSVVGQTYRNVEVILVDDGSPDRCGEICDEYALQDSRVQVVHQKNGGVSAARNIALDRASGAYVMFVDADDYIDASLVEVLVDKADELQAEILLFDHCEVNAKGIKPFFNDWYPGISAEELKRRIVRDTVYNSPWGKFFRKELWGDVRFPVGQLYEDLYVMPSVVIRANNLAYVKLSQVGYYYNRVNVDSITAAVRDRGALNRFYRALAVEEHRRIAEQMGWADIAGWAEAKVVQEMIRSLYANSRAPELSVDKLNVVFDYLGTHREAVRSLSLKYRVLFWSIFSFPLLAKLYGRVRFKFN
ncbi:MAG TPA: glycosyltransferase family 2 protein [Pseudomonas sp.]|uniref:glycosyltransferase family 2 protein n=1 Tax=Pseudomonas sp. TaxID=306 RepID=UPI002BA87DB4|nr:glycosyltransferase family 2 protein [Pseudomonas sp.]HTO18500.1 glycosyltransferase family 2 protein [Pseudomonas sp.]